jgi:capsular polysaccharide biosynthesis protein
MKKYFFQLLYGKIRIKKLSKKNYLIEKLKIDKNKTINLYKVLNGRIYTDCNTNVAYIQDNNLIPKISYQQNNHLFGSLKHNSVLYKGTPSFKKKITGKVFSLVQGASGSNYFHWLFDLLPKIEILFNNDHLKKIDFFYLPTINSFILRTLKSYGIKEKQLINSSIQKHIEADEILAFEHLYIKKGHFHNSFEKIPKWIIFFLRKKFIKLKKEISFNKQFFIDRSDSKFEHYKINNQIELKKMLKKNGFDYIQLSKIDWYKQIYIFNNAKTIIGLHGAGLANLVFCKKNTKIFEILVKNHSQINLYKNISKKIRLNYKKIIIPNKKNKKERKIELNINSLKKYFINE